MVRPEPLSRSAVLLGFDAAARDLQLNPSRLLATHGIPLRSLESPDLKIPTRSVIRLLEDAAEQSGAADFGLRMATLRPASVLGAIGLYVREQPNVRQALYSLIHYIWAQAEGLIVQLEEGTQSCILSVRATANLPSPATQTMELALASVTHIIGWLLEPGWKPRAAFFAHSRPPGGRRHTQIFGDSIVFDHEQYALVIDSATLDRPLEASSVETARQLQGYVRAVVGERSTTHTERVRELIQVLLPLGDCRADRVAQMLDVDRRTIHRYLAAEGETFRGLVEDVRHELANAYLESGNYSKTEIGQFLGFANLSSFSRWRRNNMMRKPCSRSQPTG